MITRYGVNRFGAGGFGVGRFGRVVSDGGGGASLIYNMSLLNEVTSDITYSRATAATVRDFEGLIRKCKSGEVRFSGARRVENLITSSEDMSDASYLTVSCSVSGDEIIFSSNFVIRQGFSIVPSGKTVTFSVYLKGNAGETVNIAVAAEGGTYNVTAKTVTITTSYVRYSVTHAFTQTDNTGFRAFIQKTVGSTVTVLYADKWQVEECTNQTLTTPSEYVSNGVLASFPYHGAGVDSVKYFDYANGNTVDGNGVVTEAQGSALTEFKDSGTMKGVLLEYAATNLVTYSQKFDSLTAVGTPVLTVNYSGGPVVTENSWNVQDDDAFATEGVKFDATVANDTTTRIVSIFIKKTTGTPSHYPVVGIAYSGGTGDVGRVVVDNVNGTITNISASPPDFSYIETINSNWYRVVVGLANTGGGDTTCTAQFYPAGAEDLLGAMSVAAVGTTTAAGLQLEAASAVKTATSYISTSGATATRNSDLLSFPSVSETGFTAIIGVIPVVNGENYASTSFGSLLSSDDTGGTSYEITSVFSGSANGFTPNTGAGQFELLNTEYDKDTYTAVSMSLKQDGSNATAIVTKNGAVKVNENNAQTLDNSDTAVELGHSSSGGYVMNGNYSNVKLYDDGLTSAEQQTLTTL